MTAEDMIEVDEEKVAAQRAMAALKMMGAGEEEWVAALEAGDEKEVSRFLTAGYSADWEVGRRQETALMHAVRSKKAGVVKVLLDRGATVDKVDDDGWTPLMFAATIGALPVAKALVAGGADVNACNVHGQRPISFAVQNNHIRTVEFLLDSGAEYNYRTRIGTSIPSVAAEHGYLDILKLVLRKKPDLNFAVEDATHKDPLMIAAEHGHLPVVRWLVEEEHCDPTRRTKHAVDCSILAYTNNHFEIHHYLEQYLGALGKHNPAETDLTLESHPHNTPPPPQHLSLADSVKKFLTALF